MKNEDEKNIDNLLIFRLNESASTILIHEKVKIALEKLNIEDIINEFVIDLKNSMDLHPQQLKIARLRGGYEFNSRSHDLIYFALVRRLGLIVPDKYGWRPDGFSHYTLTKKAEELYRALKKE